MAKKWFDGTFPYTEEKLASEFPVVVSPCLRISEDWKTLVIINRTEDGTFLNEISQPDFSGEKPFFHVSFGAEGEAEKEAAAHFLESARYLEDAEIKLLRQDPDALYMYAGGYIPAKLLENQQKLCALLPADLQDKAPFVLPLKVFLHPCPVCRHRTLQYRWDYLICRECGWEDEWVEDEDEEGLANGECSIRTYREAYLKRKAQNPAYRWWPKEENDSACNPALAHYLKHVEQQEDRH